MKGRTGMDLVMKLVFTLAALGLGGMLLVVGVREWALERSALRRAVPVRATILSAEVTRSESRDSDPRPLRSTSTTTWTPEVRFGYTFEGAPRESTMLDPTVIGFGYADRASAEEEIAAYCPGLVVEAWVDPLRPERAFLRNRATSRPTAFVVVGLIVLPLAWVAWRYV